MCGAQAGTACDGPDGYHVRRFVMRTGLTTLEEMADVLVAALLVYGEEVYPETVVRAGEIGEPMARLAARQAV